MDYSVENLRKILIRISLRAIFIIAIAFGLIYFLILNITKTSQSLYNDTTLTRIVEKRLDSQKLLETNVAQVSADKVNMEAIIPSENNIFDVINLFSTIAKKLGGEATISFNEADATQEFIAQRFNINIAGDITMFINYLKQLEDLPYGIKFTSASLTGVAGIHNKSDMHLELTLMMRPSIVENQ